MNIVQLQPSNLQVQQSSPSKSEESKGLFGSILSNNVAELQATTATSKPAENSDTINADELTSLLEFLNIGSMSELEQGDQLIEEMLYTTMPLEEHPLFKELIEIEGSQSIEQILASFLPGVSEEENMEMEHILQQIQQLIVGLNKEDIQTIVRNQFTTVEPVLKFSKIYTLMKNHMDLSAEQVGKIEQLEQSLGKFAAKLEELLQSSVNEKRNVASLLLGRQSYADQIQAFQSKTDTMGSQSESSGVHNPFMNMSKVEQYVLNAQNSKVNVNSDSFVKSFESILNKAQFTNQNGIQKLLIKLNPEHLGSLRVELVQREGVMMARIIASSNGAKELLDGQLQGLKQAFINQNIPVEKIELSQQFTNLSQESNLKREQFQQQRGNENAEQSTDNEEVVDEDFQNAFEEAILQAKV